MTPKHHQDKNSLTIWEIERGLMELMEAHEEAPDEPTRIEIEQALTEYFYREVQKVDRIRGYIKQNELNAREARAEAALQEGRARIFEKRAERAKALAIAALKAFGKDKIEGRTGRLSIATNGGQRPLVITDEASIPAKFSPQVISWPLDREALRMALVAGEEVPGAHLGERGEHLIVK